MYNLSQLPPLPKSDDHDYEEIHLSYVNSPQRPAPRLPGTSSARNSCNAHNVGTLGAYTELEGVPFIINSMLKSTNSAEVFEI